MRLGVGPAGLLPSYVLRATVCWSNARALLSPIVDRRGLIERWFAGRGVPQLIAGYSTEQRMDARAVPFIGAWIVVGTVLIWAQRPDAPLAQNLVGMTIALVVSAATLGFYLWYRRRPPFRSGVRLDPLDIAMIGLVPGVVAAVVHGSPGVILGVTPNVLLGVGVIYVVTGFGLVEIAGWALRHLRAQLGQITTLVARTLPVLLILVVFLLFASELWQASHTLGGGDLAAVIGLLLVVATVLVVTRARDEIKTIESTRDWPSIAEQLPGTPAESLSEVAAAASTPPRRLTWQERMNLIFLMLVSQLVQSLFVGLLVLLFLVALGLLAIPASVQETWVGEPVRTVIGFELLGEPRLLSVELLIAAGLLGGMCALYFTGLALTDAAFRADFHEQVIGDMEQIMAVHAVYLISPEVSDALDRRRRSPDCHRRASQGGDATRGHHRPVRRRRVCHPGRGRRRAAAGARAGRAHLGHVRHAVPTG